MGLASRSSSSNLANMSAERAMTDVEAAQASSEPASSHLDLLCVCIHCPYDLLSEMWRRIKMEVVVEVRGEERLSLVCVRGAAVNWISAADRGGQQRCPLQQQCQCVA